MRAMARDVLGSLGRLGIVLPWKRPLSIEQKAANIHDPVARLRYLRSSAPELVQSVPVPAKHKPRPIWRPVWSFALGLVAVLAPLQGVSDARDFLKIYKPAEGRTSAGQLAYEGEPERYPSVWLVDTQGGAELYSNGLRIETRLSVENRPRTFYRVERSGNAADDLQIAKTPTEAPAGIVFHTTESHVAPFAPEYSRKIQRAGEALLQYIQQNRSYHYVIDRFGRAFRIVRESDAANHAGWSAWADARYAYINLNDAFLGIAFEGQTASEEGGSSVSPAQVHTARVLTEMLRAKYRLPVANCVTHAQISVNPGNFEVGFHYDWGNHFPFQELGLPDNYQEPLAAVYLFGFEYTQSYLDVTSRSLWTGLRSADQRLRAQAQKEKLPVAAYTDKLRSRYSQMRAWMRARTQSAEQGEESR